MGGFVTSWLDSHNLARRLGATAWTSLRQRKLIKSSRDLPGAHGDGQALPTISAPLAPANGTPIMPPFDPRLESLRGLAALVVFVQHGMHVFADNAPFFL